MDVFDSATLRARLVDTSGHGIANVPVNFGLDLGNPNSNEACPDSLHPTLTDANGIASCVVDTQGASPANLLSPAGLYISYAGSSAYAPVAIARSILITPEETTITYLGPSIFRDGHSVTMAANVTSDSVLQPNASNVVFGLQSGDSFQSCTAVLVWVSASCSINNVQLALGTGQLTIEFQQANMLAASKLTLAVQVTAGG